MNEENESDEFLSPISDFFEGQWWIKELDKIGNASAGHPIEVTHDMKRAVAVVHHLLRAIRAQESS